MGEDGGAVAFDLGADCIRDDDILEIGEQIQASKFVEMDQWAGIADDEWRAGFSLFHVDPLHVFCHKSFRHCCGMGFEEAI